MPDMYGQSVVLVAVTQPTLEFKEETGAHYPRDVISHCARVSNPANADNYATADKLLKYCMRNGHWSPFEMAFVIMSIRCTRDIGRQILRHRSFSFQEFSQRYAEAALPVWTTREYRLQDKKNRQNSVRLTNETASQEDKENCKDWMIKQAELVEKIRETYHWALSKGIAKEQARCVLPEGLTPSHMYMAGTLRSWIHYCQLRMGNGTQLEHRSIATQCWDILLAEFPFLGE